MPARAMAFLLFFIVLLAALSPALVLASGVGVSPSELEFEARSPGSIRTLFVINTGDEESHYRVYAEGEYEDWFEISPEEFLLAPGQSMEVEIALSPPFAASGEHTANICVVSFEPSLGLQIGTGVKVPAHISILGPPLLMVIGIAGALAVLVAAYLLWRRMRAT